MKVGNVRLFLAKIQLFEFTFVNTMFEGLIPADFSIHFHCIFRSNVLWTSVILSRSQPSLYFQPMTIWSQGVLPWSRRWYRCAPSSPVSHNIRFFFHANFFPMIEMVVKYTFSVSPSFCIISMKHVLPQSGYMFVKQGLRALHATNYVKDGNSLQNSHMYHVLCMSMWIWSGKWKFNSYLINAWFTLHFVNWTLCCQNIQLMQGNQDWLLR